MCKCKNGATIARGLVAVPTGTASVTTQEYMVDLLHYLCGNRKVCVNGQFPLSATLNFGLVGNPVSIGNNAYACTINVTGSLTYEPFVQGCCNVCPRQDYIGLQIVVPIYSATGMPSVTLSNTSSIVDCSTLATSNCCTLTNEVRMVTSLVVNTTAPTS